MTEEKKENRGGKRVGAGPKFIYGEDTCNITLRVPTSKKDEIKKVIYSYLNQFKVGRDDVKEKGGHYGC
jgi:hypothetical protein